LNRYNVAPKRMHRQKCAKVLLTLFKIKDLRQGDLYALKYISIFFIPLNPFSYDTPKFYSGK